MTLSGVLNSIGLIGYVTFLVHPARTGRDKRGRDDKGGTHPNVNERLTCARQGTYHAS